MSDFIATSQYDLYDESTSSIATMTDSITTSQPDLYDEAASTTEVGVWSMLGVNIQGIAPPDSALTAEHMPRLEKNLEDSPFELLVYAARQMEKYVTQGPRLTSKNAIERAANDRRRRIARAKSDRAMHVKKAKLALRRSIASKQFTEMQKRMKFIKALMLKVVRGQDMSELQSRLEAGNKRIEAIKEEKESCEEEDWDWDWDCDWERAQRNELEDEALRAEKIKSLDEEMEDLKVKGDMLTWLIENP
ncbi:hypothetical protein DSL72_000181 [Monilinia vaccinii-corymbosi]|uniref:Uncharacterized protein n=1 Tax=Monilinia vaccinii-corymbosi TaxID=61207 RepID=A0A8A3P3R8_9HELO|nr:hypothetical protein DSL72_000181 [Monilinia vaccinii-corymbosi]